MLDIGIRKRLCRSSWLAATRNWTRFAAARLPCFPAKGRNQGGLKVQQDNPSGALPFYESLGMIRISEGGNEAAS
jgi:hypothetical protein